MKTILITAYAVNPYKGSEDGTGWNITREIAKEYKVILITRKNNVPHLDRYFEEHPDGELSQNQIEYYGFDLPDWVCNIKKRLGSKGHVLYFYLWQRFVIGFINANRFSFDATMSLNFHSDSHPHFLYKLKRPVFWGPIGHHPKVPKPFLLQRYGWKAFAIDRSFYYMKWLMRNVNPAFRKAVRHSEKIFVINSSIQKVIGAPENKVVQLPAVAAKSVHSIVESVQLECEVFTILSAGRFHFMKGFDVALNAYFAFLDRLTESERQKVQLVLVGKGAEEQRLKEFARKSGYEDRVKWISWVAHKEMDALYRKSDVFLFPSHEGAGMVVPEAMSYGIPVLAFDNYGPGELVGHDELLVPYESYAESIARFSDKLLDYFQHPELLSELQKKMKLRHAEAFTWESKGRVIRNEIKHLIPS